MKIVAFNGSPRVNGNTAHALRLVLAELEREGFSTELVQLGGRRLAGCQACNGCAESRDGHCAAPDDGMNEYIDRMMAADAIIIGSPTYFSNVTTEVKALIDRAGYVAGANGNMLKGKVGAAVVAVRRSGGNFVYAAINYFFGINEMIVPGSDYWNTIVARDPEDWKKDAEGIQTMQTLGRNMAALLHRLHSSDRPV